MSDPVQPAEPSATSELDQLSGRAGTVAPETVVQARDLYDWQG